MKKKSQLFCTAAAFLLTVPILNGCSSKQTQTSEMLEISSAENPSTEETSTEETSTETLSDGETQTAATETDSIMENTVSADHAKNAYNAMNCALTDLEAWNYNVTDIDKTLTYHGSDFADLKPAELNENGSPSASETLALLPSLVLTYFNEIDEADTVVFAIENGTCQAAAWKLENGNYDVYPYPHDGRTEWQEYSSAEDALASAQEYLS